MSDLSELEVIDRMQTSLREAIQASIDLAQTSRKGPTYNKLREHLALVEGACRQLSVFRQDTRWLPIGRLVSECHAKAGGWLRGYKDPLSGRRIHFGAKTQNPLFLMLAENLKGVYQLAENLRTSKTGRVGMILPDMPAATRRIGAPVSVMLPDGMRAHLSKGGILLPPRMST